MNNIIYKPWGRINLLIKPGIIFPLVLVFLISPTIVTAQDGSGDQMPDYAKSIIVDNHYIKITQESPNSLLVEELIWYKNEGTEDHTGKIYTWAQPGDILKEISQFDAVIDQTYYYLKVYPSGNFLVSDLKNNNMSIAANESLEIVFVYSLEYPLTDQFTFTKTFLYNNSNVIIIIEPNENFKVDGKEGLKLIYESNTKTYVTEHAVTLSKELSEYITVEFTKKSNAVDEDGGTAKSGDPSLMNLIYIFAIIIIAIIITIFVRYQRQKTLAASKASQAPQATPRAIARQKTRKKTDHEKGGRVTGGPSEVGKKITKTKPAKSLAKKPGKKQEKKQGKKPTEKPPDKSRSRLIQEKKKLLKTIERIKSDHKEGVISKEIFDKLKNEYKQKLKNINKKIERIDKQGELGGSGEIEADVESLELEKLMNKKEKILKAIKKLDEDKEAGVLDKDLYDEMSAAYKKQAIEILKKIDHVREK